jgi:hypothetical protein
MPPELRIVPYNDLATNEHWIDRIDTLPPELKWKVRAIFPEKELIDDRGDRFEIERAPTEKEVEAIKALCQNNGITFHPPYIRTLEAYKEERRRLGRPELPGWPKISLK